jgi:hypothetical protein
VGALDVAVADVNANIVDNDAAGVLLAESSGATRVGEDGLSDSYTVVLTSRPGTTVVITLQADNDLDVSPQTLRFTTADWNQPQTVTVRAIDDAAVVGQESASIHHDVSGGVFAGIVVADIVVTIDDNDRVEVIQLARGLDLVGWFGAPTTFHAIIEGNRFILRIWGWDAPRRRWIVDDPLLPSSLRSNFTITLGQGFFVVTSTATELEVPLS